MVPPDKNKLGGSCRSREGAWIEIKPLPFRKKLPVGRSREGAWIEMAR